MIIDHIPVRLYWEPGRHGHARYNGEHVDLHERPDWVVWWNVDFAPGYSATCRERACDPPRDLRPDEVGMILLHLPALVVRSRAVNQSPCAARPSPPADRPTG